MGPRLVWWELAECMPLAFSVLHKICILLIIAAFQMALCLGDQISGSIIDYLLVDAWDIENSYNLQTLAYIRPALYGGGGSRDLNQFFQLSRRISALGHAIEGDNIYTIVRCSLLGLISNPASKEFTYSDILKFLISQGADIEWRDSVHMETALLVAAEADHMTDLRLMQELLWLDADYSAVDYKGRGALHLALKRSRFYTHKRQGLVSFRVMKDKLVYLLQAGCSIHAVDSYGRNPTDVARIWRRMKLWETALQEVGKLVCASSKCQCEIIVSLPQAFRLSKKGLRLLRKIVTDAQLTIAKD